MSSESSTKKGSTVIFDQAKNYFATRKASACCSYLLSYLKPGFHILDVGSGPGSITADLAQLVPQGHVTGFEISPVTIEHAKNLVASRGITNIDFIQGDAQELSSYFPSKKFDIVHAHMVVMHFSDPVAVLQQMRKVLKPGGLLAIRDTIRHTLYPVQAGPDSHQDAVDTVMRLRGGHPHGGLENHTWVHEAGFAWEDIRFGVDNSEVAGKDKPLLVPTVRETIATIAKAVQSERSTEEIIKDWSEYWDKWEQNEEARLISLDGWVLASL